MGIKYFEPFEFYMHNAQMDICLEVLEVASTSKGNVELLVHYWNLGYTGRPWRVTMKPVHIRVNESSFDMWNHIDYDQLTEPRYKVGPP